MRVLMFYEALVPYRVDLFNALAARCEFRVVFLHSVDDSPIFSQPPLRAKLIADHAFLTGGLAVKHRVLRPGMHREIHRFSPDVVVTPEFSPTTLAVLARRALPRERYYAHVVRTSDNPATLAGDSWLRAAARKVVLPHINGLIVLSDRTASSYRERYRLSAPVGISPLLHNEVVFRAALAGASDDVRRIIVTYNLLGKRVLLFVGRLSPEKQVDQLIRAFGEIHDGIPDAILALVGNGAQRSSLESLAAACGIAGKTIFAGPKQGNELCAWYRVGAVLALPSSQERFGAVVNEALLAGMPVVCSDRAGASGLIREGETGVVIDPFDRQALARALRQWIRRAPPLDPEAQELLRPSLMAATFSAAVDGFLNVAADAYAERVSGVHPRSPAGHPA